MARKDILPKDRICPILSIGREATINCHGESCALFKGEEKRIDGECAISDISGWLKNLTELAGAEEPTKEEPEDEKEGPAEETPENK
jgi:hypothetical protein